MHHPEAPGITDVPKWRRMLRRELEHRMEFENFSRMEWSELLKKRDVTSENHDTVLSLDWPHYCSGASDGCGGSNGWCYTFTGLQAGGDHLRKVAMVDVLAERWPDLFAEKVSAEVDRAVSSGRLPYRNLRYCGSGELSPTHIAALTYLQERGIHLWGFTRRMVVARALRRAGICVIVSYDRSSPAGLPALAAREGFRLAYASTGVDDTPTAESFVVFPLHRSGRIREVVGAPGLCPKVVHEYFQQERPRGTCQIVCQRCHRP